MPPPPVTGAAVGIGLGDGLGEGSGLGLSDADELAEALALSDELALSLELDEAPPLAVLVAVELTLTEPLAVGRYVEAGGVEVEVEPEVQAESARQASMAVRPQPMAVSRTRCDVPAMAVRALIEPPRVLGNDHFPVAGLRNEENVGDLNVKPER